MAFEKRWSPVAVQLLSADGTTDGQLQVPDAFTLKVKQLILLKSGTQPTLQVQVKRVISPNILFVGNPERSIDDRLDVSAYLTADGASISNPDQKQPRPAIGIEDFARAVYEEEPTVAIRTISVDRGGRPIGTDPDSPFYVQLTDGSVNIGTVNAELEVQLSHKDNDPDVGDVHDSVRVGDGVDQLEINPDGSINAVIVSGGSVADPFVANVPAASAGTEYSFAFPTGTIKFKLRARGTSKLQLAYVLGDTATDYFTLIAGNSYDESMDVSGKTIYFLANKNTEVVEIIYWKKP